MCGEWVGKLCLVWCEIWCRLCVFCLMIFVLISLVFVFGFCLWCCCDCVVEFGGGLVIMGILNVMLDLFFDGGWYDLLESVLV